MGYRATGTCVLILERMGTEHSFVCLEREKERERERERERVPFGVGWMGGGVGGVGGDHSINPAERGHHQK